MGEYNVKEYVKNLLLTVLCLIGAVGQFQETRELIHLTLAALKAVDPMTVACSIAGAAGVHVVANTDWQLFLSTTAWNASAEDKIINCSKI